MKIYNRETGRIGEDVALDYLTKKGYELVLRNFSTRFGEIDLIMRDKDVLVFVEVKTKKGLAWGSPEEMFTRNKLARVRRMAEMYLKGKEVACRIDMVAVVLNQENELVLVRHYEGV